MSSNNIHFTLIKYILNQATKLRITFIHRHSNFLKYTHSLQLYKFYTVWDNIGLNEMLSAIWIPWSTFFVTYFQAGYYQRYLNSHPDQNITTVHNILTVKIYMYNAGIHDNNNGNNEELYEN